MIEFCRSNQRKLLETLDGVKEIKKGVLFLKGNTEVPNYDDDGLSYPSTEPTFFHLFGLAEPETWATVDLETSRSTLWIRKMTPEESIWSIDKGLAYYRSHYAFDEVDYIDHLPSYFKALALERRSDFVIYVNGGVSVFSGCRSATPEQD